MTPVQELPSRLGGWIGTGGVEALIVFAAVIGIQVVAKVVLAFVQIAL
jgi:hypothetical protein